MYQSLNNSALSITGVSDSNSVLRYPIPATADFTTEWIKVFKEDKTITFDILPSGLNGTGTVKLEHTRDKINYYDLLSASGSVVSLGVTSSNTADYICTQNFPYGYIRAKFTKGTNSTGTITIIMEK